MVVVAGVGVDIAVVVVIASWEDIGQFVVAVGMVVDVDVVGRVVVVVVAAMIAKGGTTV